LTVFDAVTFNEKGSRTKKSIKKHESQELIPVLVEAYWFMAMYNPVGGCKISEGYTASLLSLGLCLQKFRRNITASIHRCEETKLVAQLPTFAWLTPARQQCHNSKGGGERIEISTSWKN